MSIAIQRHRNIPKYKWNKYSIYRPTIYVWNQYTVSTPQNVTYLETSETVTNPTKNNSRMGYAYEKQPRTLGHTYYEPTSGGHGYVSGGSWHNQTYSDIGYNSDRLHNVEWPYFMWFWSDAPEYYKVVRTTSSGDLVCVKYYFKEKITYDTPTCGDYIGQVTSSNASAYPSNGQSGSYWYIRQADRTGDAQIGSFIEVVESFDERAYPNNGISGDYWYVRV